MMENIIRVNFVELATLPGSLLKINGFTIETLNLVQGIVYSEASQGDL